MISATTKKFLNSIKSHDNHLDSDTMVKLDDTLRVDKEMNEAFKRRQIEKQKTIHKTQHMENSFESIPEDEVQSFLHGLTAGLHTKDFEMKITPPEVTEKLNALERLKAEVEEHLQTVTSKLDSIILSGDVEAIAELSESKQEALRKLDFYTKEINSLEQSVSKL